MNDKQQLKERAETLSRHLRAATGPQAISFFFPELLQFLDDAAKEEKAAAPTDTSIFSVGMALHDGKKVVTFSVGHSQLIISPDKVGLVVEMLIGVRQVIEQDNRETSDEQRTHQ